MLRVGLIGAGGMARVYANRIARMEDVEVTSVASPRTANSFVREHVPDATPYATADRLCDDENVDAVAVVTPTHTHREVVTTAAEYGLDVICEKPLSRTLEDAYAIKDAVEDTGIRFMTAHAVRFFPDYAVAKERVEAGEIGTPGVVRTRRAFGYDGERGWFDDPSKSGGVLLDLAIHDFDYLRWLLGDVERVFTRHVGWSDRGHSEISLTLLRFETGAVGQVEAWWVEVPSVPFTTAFELAGDEGLIEYDNDEVRPITTYDVEGVHVPRDPVGHDLPLRRDGYYRQLEHFFDCIDARESPSISVDDGIESMKLSLAAIESAERGEPVSPYEVVS